MTSILLGAIKLIEMGDFRKGYARDRDELVLAYSAAAAFGARGLLKGVYELTIITTE